MKRTAPIKRTPVRKVNAARRRREFARAYGSKERVAFVKSLPCIAWRHQCIGQIENAHVGNGGAGRKADAGNVVPMCKFHHAQLHRMGQKSFESLHGLSLEHEAILTQGAWEDASGESKSGRAFQGEQA